MPAQQYVQLEKVSGLAVFAANRVSAILKPVVAFRV
jgi:hypothetical protein